MSRRNRWLIATSIPLALLIGPFVIIGQSFWLWSAIAVECFRDRTSPQLVDLSPLMQVTLPPDLDSLTDVLDPEIFDSYTIRDEGVGLSGEIYYHPPEDSHKWSDIYVDLFLWNTTSAASENVRQHCKDEFYFPEPEEANVVVQGDNEYCLSYAHPDAVAFDTLCLPLQFHSHVAFRKQRLVIDISEYAHNNASTRTDELIKRLAQDLQD